MKKKIKKTPLNLKEILSKEWPNELIAEAESELGSNGPCSALGVLAPGLHQLLYPLMQDPGLGGPDITEDDFCRRRVKELAGIEDRLHNDKSFREAFNIKDETNRMRCFWSDLAYLLKLHQLLQEANPADLDDGLLEAITAAFDPDADDGMFHTVDVVVTTLQYFFGGWIVEGGLLWKVEAPEELSENYSNDEIVEEFAIAQSSPGSVSTTPPSDALSAKTIA